ncbi:Phytanoyl-CoA dioxygenase [Balamuthia mandrillaris]
MEAPKSTEEAITKEEEERATTETQGEEAAEGGLTPAQRRQFEEEGWLVIPNVLSPEQCERTIQQLADFLAAKCDVHILDSNQRESWNKWPLSKMGFSDCYSLPAMWENRQNPFLHSIFSTLLGTDELWVSIDRMGSKRPGIVYDEGGNPLDMSEWHRDALVHTDCNLWYPPRKLEIQGLVALNDTDPGQGGFACIPGFHKEHWEWTRAHPEWKVTNPKRMFNPFPDKQMIQDRLKHIPMKAGDLLIWDNLLPHTNTRNTTDKWRFCQYIRMVRAEPANERFRRFAAEAYLHGRRPLEFSTGGRVPQDYCTIEQEGYPQPPALTELGERLVGLKPWREGEESEEGNGGGAGQRKKAAKGKRGGRNRRLGQGK